MSRTTGSGVGGSKLVRASTIAASSLLIATVGLIVLALVNRKELAIGALGLSDRKGQITYVGADRRLVRRAAQRGSVVVCVETPRHLQIMTERNTSGKPSSSVPPALTSTAKMREAGWQLCNAYANGVIDKEQYAKLLARVVTAR